MATLEQPAAYLPALSRLRERNPYARAWVLRVERKTNRHTTTNGQPWGWYEVFPLGVEVGFWESGGSDDLRAVDVDAWNAEAARLSTEGSES